jgi:hypothetical protein
MNPMCNCDHPRSVHGHRKSGLRPCLAARCTCTNYNQKHAASRDFHFRLTVSTRGAHADCLQCGKRFWGTSLTEWPELVGENFCTALATHDCFKPKPPS